MKFGYRDSRETITGMYYRRMGKIYIPILVAFTLLACSSVPSAKVKTVSEPRTAEETDRTPKREKTQKGDRAVNAAPEPGDTKVVDGIEYIYATNRRYMSTPSEPEYVWIRKDQYTPRVGEHLLSDGWSKKEKEDLEDRISRLEQELKKRNMPSQ